ncbi:hypothetical protein B0H16DRAFT_1468641 [Mycena metata]|uniref:Uncharacterized protein n=1 Tax=Mycena metata TaxID=1033252 RepID=A0AAD7I0H2_9AGAR|nr:hypothetical protein B0H16DRAFT_1468641 [Mycena metata]
MWTYADLCPPTQNDVLECIVVSRMRTHLMNRLAIFSLRIMDLSLKSHYSRSGKASPSPPPVYEHPPQYAPEPPVAAAPLSSSSPPRLRRALSASPSLSDLEVEVFGHRVAPLPSPFTYNPQNPLPPPSFSPPRADVSRVPSFHTPQVPRPFVFPDAATTSDLPPPRDDQSFPSPPPAHLSVFPVEPKPKATCTRRAAPARPPSPDDELPDAKDFEIMVWTYAAAKKAIGRKPKKALKPEPNSFGPISANTDMTWDNTVEAICELLSTSPQFLVSSSMEWHWLKPKNSAWLPLRNLAGYASLVKQIVSPPKGVTNYIIIKMDEPMKAPPSVSMPWASQPVAGPSSSLGAFENVFRAATGIDNGPSDDDDGMPKKKVPFDDGLEEDMQKISDTYHPGVCSVHPDIECFHSHINNLHFALDRPEKIVWAAGMKNGTASIIAPPLGSTYFRVKAAIKKNVSTPATPAPAPAVPATVPLAPAPPATPFPQYPYLAHMFPPMPMGYPGYPPFPTPGYFSRTPRAPWEETPRERRRERSWDGSSPPRQSTSKRRHPDPPSSSNIHGAGNRLVGNGRHRVPAASNAGSMGIKDFIKRNCCPAGSNEFRWEWMETFAEESSLISSVFRRIPMEMGGYLCENSPPHSTTQLNSIAPSKFARTVFGSMTYSLTVGRMNFGDLGWAEGRVE